MNTDKPVYVSADGLKKLDAELEELRTSKRAEVAERIHNAMEFGDFSENSELEQAKDRLAKLRGRSGTDAARARVYAIHDLARQGPDARPYLVALARSEEADTLERLAALSALARDRAALSEISAATSDAAVHAKVRALARIE
jgi:hypothetical protein